MRHTNIGDMYTHAYITYSCVYTYIHNSNLIHMYKRIYAYTYIRVHHVYTYVNLVYACVYNSSICVHFNNMSRRAGIYKCTTEVHMIPAHSVQ